MNLQKFLKQNSHFIIRLLFLFMILCIPGTAVSASELKLNYDNKNSTYSSKTVTVTLDKKTVSLGKTPGIVMNGTSMIPYDLVFQKAAGSVCTYNSKSGVLTIKKNNNSVKMTVGSKTAYVNGKKVTMPAPPKKVTYIAAKTAKILVPSEFTANSLGYGFSWTSDTKNIKVALTKPFTYYMDETIQYYNGVQGKASINKKLVSDLKMPVIAVDGTELSDAKAVFCDSAVGADYQYEKASKKLTLTKDDVTIVFEAGSDSAQVNGESYPLDTTVREVKKTIKGELFPIVPLKFTAEQFGYNYSINTASGTSVLTIKPPVREPGQYFTWSMSPEFTQPVTAIQMLPGEYHLQNAVFSQGSIVSVTQNTMVQDGNEHYIVTSSQPFGNIDAVYDPVTGGIKIFCQNIGSVDNFYTYGEEGNVSDISTELDETGLNTTIFVNAKIPNMKYSLNLSPDNYILEIVVYPNYITQLTADYKDEKDYLTITGVTGLNPEITSDEESIYVDFHGTINALNSQAAVITDINCFADAAISQLDMDTVRLAIRKEGMLSYTVETVENTANQIVIVLQKKSIMVAVDCGHGANTPGKRTPPIPYDLDFDGDGIVDAKKGEQIREHTPDLGVGKYLAEELRRCGFGVYESAFGTEDIPLLTRKANIKKAGCDYSISVHFNASGDGKSFNSSEGTEVYLYDDIENAGDSKALAQSVLNEIVKGTKQKNRGYHKKNLSMCRVGDMGTKASILVECAFMTNLNEMVNMVANEEYWKETASEIARGFCNYLNVPYVEE